ncbi:hypothetical protein ABH935_008018 [Catenulispora sp. GAS73]
MAPPAGALQTLRDPQPPASRARHVTTARVRTRVDRVHTTGRGCPGFPVASAGAAKLTGPVVSSRTKPHHSSVRSDLIPPDRSASVRRRRDGEPGTRRPQATTASTQRDPPSPERAPLAAQAPPEALPLAFDFRCPPHPAASRPPDVCAVTRTCARSCTRTPPAANPTSGAPPNCATQRILLKPARSRKKLLKPTNRPHPPHPSHPHPHPHINQGRPIRPPSIPI